MTAVSAELSSVLRALPGAALLVDGSGRVLAANESACTLTGSPLARLDGSPLAELVVESEEVLRSRLEMWSRSRQSLPGGLTWRDSTGRQIPLRCDGAAVVPAGESSHAVVLLLLHPRLDTREPFHLLREKVDALTGEVRERRRLERERAILLQREKDARLEAERQSRLKDEFLATLSHELRTPLNAILGWTELLQGDPGAGVLEEGREVIERNARLQKQLIEDLLDVSRIISGRVRLEMGVVDVPSVVHSAVQSVRPMAKERRVRLESVQGSLSGWVHGDADRVQQIVWNLLTNALKFTPAGGDVCISIAESGGKAEISVRDTGEGIDPAFIPHLFERFRQAEATTTRRHGGLGLGLSIVRQLTELHGGRVEAESEGLGKGATFRVYLPLTLGEPRMPAGKPVEKSPAAIEAENGTALRGLRVLVVDDEPDSREVLRRLLRRAGADVEAAGSADEAMELAGRSSLDAIVSDIAMPGVDGYELVRRLRETETFREGRRPVVAVSAFVRPEDRARSRVAGFDEHLAKPLDPDELIRLLRHLVNRSAQSNA